MEPVYVATVNVPGYLPENEPVAFGTAGEAWSYLADERRRDEQCDESSDGYTDLVDQIDKIAQRFDPLFADIPCDRGPMINDDGTGVVYAGTPGSDSPHDLGLAYVVSLVTHADYPHEPGYLYGCLACEAMCHCAPGASQCVYWGEHDV